MGIDASIALSGKPIEVPNQLNQMAAMYQMQGAQNANALAKYQLSSAQRADAQQNMLNQAYSSSVNPDGTIDYGKLNAALATGNAGSLIPAANKQRFDAQKAQTEAQKVEGELVDQRLKQSRSLLDGVTTPEQYIAWHEANHKDPVLGKYLADRGVTAEQSRAKITDAIQKGPEAFAQLLNESKLGAEKAMEQHFMEQGSGAQKWTSAVPKYGTGVPAKIIPGTIVNQVATPDAVLRDNRQKSEGALNRAAQIKAAEVRNTGGLTEEQTTALFGPDGAVTTGKLNPDRINSRTAKILADAYILNPKTDMNALAQTGALMRNAPYMARAQTTEMLPEILSNVVEAGKKVDYPDTKFLGMVKQFALGQVNDPDFISYMAQRNDALLTIAGVMRGNGATDQAHKAEIEASTPTMSPRALDAWIAAQMKALEPRLKNAQRFTRSAAPAAVPPKPGTTIKFDAQGNLVP